MFREMLLYAVLAFSTCNVALCIDRVGIEILRVKVGNESIKPVDKLSDIIRHCQSAPFGLDSGRSTQAHETVHIINSQTRAHLVRIGFKRTNAFYCGGGDAMLIADPNIRIRHVSNFVPKVLRGSRYNLYFIEQAQHWDEIPTYIIDEWSAYLAGAEVGVEDFFNGLPKENSDIVSGALEFSLYSIALCIATKELDPHYWESDQRLKQSVKYFLIRSERVFFKGEGVFRHKGQDLLLSALRNDETTEPFRDFIVQEFDGMFLR